MQARVKVYRFQRSAAITCAWVGPHEGVPYLCRAIHDDLFDPEQECCVLPACPQPSTDFLAMLEVPPWMMRSLKIPVLIEVHPAPVSRFVEVFIGRVTLEDLRSAVGDKWIAGGVFFVGASKEPVQPDDVITPEPGLLIRLYPRRIPLQTCVPLAVKLRNPASWFRPTSQSHEGACDDVPGRGGVGLVGPWGDWACPPTFDGMTAKSLRQAISSVCGLPASQLLLVAPDAAVADLLFRGEPVASVLSVMSQALDGACIVFVDARDLGVPLRAVALPPHPLAADELLRLAGGDRPHGVSVCIGGATAFDAGAQTLVPVHKALIQFLVVRNGDLPSGSRKLGVPRLRPEVDSAPSSLPTPVSGPAWESVLPACHVRLASPEVHLSVPLQLCPPATGRAPSHMRAPDTRVCVATDASGNCSVFSLAASSSAGGAPLLQCRKRVRSPESTPPVRGHVAAHARRESEEVRTARSGAFHRTRLEARTREVSRSSPFLIAPLSTRSFACLSDSSSSRGLTLSTVCGQLVGRVWRIFSSVLGFCSRTGSPMSCWFQTLSRRPRS